MNIYWLDQTDADVPPGEDWLSVNELACLNVLRFPKRRADWRLGRWTAKRALSGYFNLPRDPRELRRIEISPAPSGAPEVLYRRQRAGVRISLSHRDGNAICAITASGVEMGCDLEVVEPHSAAFASDYFTAEEQLLVAQAPADDRHRLLALLWSAKESALKAMRVGLRVDTRSVRISDLGEPFDIIGWSPLSVHYAGEKTVAGQASGNEVFHGWWQQAGNILRTVVAAPPPDAPISLALPVHSSGNSSRWKTVAS